MDGVDAVQNALVQATAVRAIIESDAAIDEKVKSLGS